MKRKREQRENKKRIKDGRKKRSGCVCAGSTKKEERDKSRQSARETREKERK